MFWIALVKISTTAHPIIKEDISSSTLGTVILEVIISELGMTIIG